MFGDTLYLAMMVLWVLWKTHCSLVFVGGGESTEEVVEFARSCLAEFRHKDGAMDKGDSVSVASGSTLLWKPPPVGSLKINKDVIYFCDTDDNGRMGAGAVVRTSDGVVIRATTLQLQRIKGKDHAKMMALLLGIELAKRCGVVCFILESDSWNIINCFSMGMETNLSSYGPMHIIFSRKCRKTQ